MSRHFPLDLARLRRRTVLHYCTSATPRCTYPVFEFFWSSGRMRDVRLGAKEAFRPRFLQSGDGGSADAGGGQTP